MNWISIIIITVVFGYTYINSSITNKTNEYIREYRYTGYGGWRYIENQNERTLNFFWEKPESSTWSKSLYQYAYSYFRSKNN